MALIAIDARLINSSTGTYIERLLHYLEQIDTTNDYIVLVPAKDKEYWTPTSSNFSVIAADFDAFSIAEQVGFKRLLDKLKPDLVHFCLPQQPVLYTGTKVTTFHDLTLLQTYNSDVNWFVFHFKQFVGRFVFKRIAATSERLFVPTRFTKHELIKFTGADESKIILAYEAAEVPRFDRLRPYKLPFERFIVYVGQQPDYKNIRRLAAAHQQLRRTYPDLGLVLVGKIANDTKANQVYFERQEYQGIHFTDYIPNEQRDWLMKHAEAYVFASLLEGFGLPGLEAMAAGVPVVSSNATCLPEVYSDAAEYFDPMDVNDMATAIERVITDKARRDILIQRGYEQVKKYSWRIMAEQTHKAYLDVLK